MSVVVCLARRLVCAGGCFVAGVVPASVRVGAGVRFAGGLRWPVLNFRCADRCCACRCCRQGSPRWWPRYAGIVGPHGC
jgi:hypothetical protein